MTLPTSGSGWDRMIQKGVNGSHSPRVSDQDNNNNVQTLARALVGLRMIDSRLIEKARGDIMRAIGTESGGRTLAAGRNVAAYVIAADLIGLSTSDRSRFSDWLRNIRVRVLDGKTIISTHEDRPNNWGTMAGGSRIAIAAYLGDQREIDRSAQVFHGWLGNRSVYSGFKFGDLDWQSDPKNPRAINPRGTVLNGRNMDGGLPEELRRAGGFRWPPPKENYCYETFQGAIVQAELLQRLGYSSYRWGESALYRAYAWLHEQAKFPPEGDDTWITYLVNRAYGSTFPLDPQADHGKIMGWTAWTHQK